MASLTSNNKTLEELILTLYEDMRLSRITKADRDKTLLDILKKQKENIEQNQKKINEQQELIEHLWAWAEERDEEKYKGMTPSEADAAAYMDIMYPVEEEEKEEEDNWGWAGEGFPGLSEKTMSVWDTTPQKCEDETLKNKDDNLAPVTYWDCDAPISQCRKKEPCNNYIFDYRNFKLYDEYCGEKKGYKFLLVGPHGTGYYKVIDK